MLIAQSTLSHISQLNGSFGTRIHEPVATQRVEFGSCNNFREFFHVGRLDVNNIEALILCVEIPQIDTQIIAADESLSIAVYRDAVDVIRVGIGICASRDSSNYRIMVCEARELQVGCVPEALSCCERSRGTAAATGIAWGKVLRQVVLRNNFQGLFENLPEFDGLVIGRQQVVRGVLATTPFDFVYLLLNLQ